MSTVMPAPVKPDRTAHRIARATHYALKDDPVVTGVVSRLIGGSSPVLTLSNDGSAIAMDVTIDGVPRMFLIEVREV